VIGRREFITLLGGVAARPVAARAQQQAMPVIGFLDTRSPETAVERLRAYRLGLREAGYTEGENVTILYRWAESIPDRLPELAADLVRRQVTVITAAGGPLSATAAKAATKQIPIVFIAGEDPVRLGLVSSLARPDGNLTGINLFNAELEAKRLALFRELVPRAARIAVLVSTSDAKNTDATLRDVGVAARTLGLLTSSFSADSSLEIDSAFARISREQFDAVFVSGTPLLHARHVQLVQQAAFYHLPATYGLREYSQVGGLMSYGTNVEAVYRQVGMYAGLILKGAKPGDLPVVQSNKFELVINASTARLLGLTVPPTLLAIADEVIE
jgi:ABC-type uncharacterized transport system substrate-binding protein